MPTRQSQPCLFCMLHGTGMEHLPYPLQPQPNRLGGNAVAPGDLPQGFTRQPAAASVDIALAQLGSDAPQVLFRIGVVALVATALLMTIRKTRWASG